MKIKYLVLGNHPIFQYINRRCMSLKEAENVKFDLEAIEYDVTIEPLEEENER
jgi:hypothetical protein